VSEKSESTKLARINLAAGSRYEHIDLRSLPTFDGELETLVMNPENTMHIDQLPKNVWCGTCSSTTQIQPLVHHYGEYGNSGAFDRTHAVTWRTTGLGRLIRNCSSLRTVKQAISDRGSPSLCKGMGRSWLVPC
jgi:hypothetical protein